VIEPPPLQQVDRTYVRMGNRKLSYFAGCDYFRMASHPGVLKGVQEGLKRFGLSVAASRMTTGNHAVFAALETRLAKFFAAPGALIVSNGYVTNMIVAQAVKGNFSHALIDEKAHPSLNDAAQFLNCPVIRFAHRSPTDLSKALTRCGSEIKPLLLTDGMFSSEGEIAPLAEYLKVLPPDGIILLDDAHGAGTLGKTGKGTPELTGVSTKRIIQTITLSKAFGVYGGAILCGRPLRERILRESHAFAGHTPLPLPLACAAIKSVEILSRDKACRQRLNDNVRYAKTILRQKNIPVADTPAPLIAIVPKSQPEVARLRTRLLARKVFPSFIHYPGGPKNGYFRFVLCSEHTREQLDSLLGALES
jgi:7-keto-8-aminopelargonate synthetase-like enzyme